jgi:hypothetical protein
VRGRLLFIPLEVKRSDLDEFQVFKLEKEHQIPREGAPHLGFELGIERW